MGERRADRLTRRIAKTYAKLRQNDSLPVTEVKALRRDLPAEVVTRLTRVDARSRPPLPTMPPGTADARWILFPELADAFELRVTPAGAVEVFDGRRWLPYPAATVGPVQVG
jgi:hypothetical protein